jgi:hypothetical protein
MDMFKTISQALKVKEIRGKMIFTLLMLVVFRIGSNIPVPGINREYLAQMFSGDNMGLFELFNLFSGGEDSIILEFGNEERILNGYWMVIANPRYNFYEGMIEMADWTLLRLVPGIE